MGSPSQPFAYGSGTDSCNSKIEPSSLLEPKTDPDVPLHITNRQDNALYILYLILCLTNVCRHLSSLYLPVFQKFTGGTQQFKVVGDNAISGNLETYIRVSSKLKLGVGGDEFSVKLNSPSSKTQRSVVETDTSGSVKTGRIPVRLYVCNVHDDFEDLEDAPHVDSWDKIAYINRPIEIHREGKYFSLLDAIKTLLPEFFAEKNSISEEMPRAEVEDEQKSSSGDGSGLETVEVDRETLREHVEPCSLPDNAEIKLLRIQGIQPKLETPFAWLANNLMNPERFLHICAYVRVPNQSPFDILPFHESGLLCIRK